MLPQVALSAQARGPLCSPLCCCNKAILLYMMGFAVSRSLTSMSHWLGARCGGHVLEVQYVSGCLSLVQRSGLVLNSLILRVEHCREGFSLLLYGFGSKRGLLERFALEALLDGGVLSVNGLCRGLSVRALLLRVASAMRLPRCLGLPGRPQPELSVRALLLRVASAMRLPRSLSACPAAPRRGRQGAGKARARATAPPAVQCCTRHATAERWGPAAAGAAAARPSCAPSARCRPSRRCTSSSTTLRAPARPHPRPVLCSWLSSLRRRRGTLQRKRGACMLGPAWAGASRRLRSSSRGRHMTWHPGRAFRAASWAARAGLRAAGAQALLSELAACACIGLVASADHVNAPLLWDKQARAGPHALRFDPGAPAGCFGARSRSGRQARCGPLSTRSLPAAGPLRGH